MDKEEVVNAMYLEIRESFGLSQTMFSEARKGNGAVLKRVVQDSFETS